MVIEIKLVYSVKEVIILNKALFLDRDGVINNNKKPVNKPKDFQLYEGVKEALSKAQKN